MRDNGGPGIDWQEDALHTQTADAPRVGYPLPEQDFVDGAYRRLDALRAAPSVDIEHILDADRR